MSEPRHTWRLYLACAFAVLVLYLVGIGPAHRHKLSLGVHAKTPFLSAMYAPLYRAAHVCPTFGEPLANYIDLWAPNKWHVYYDFEVHRMDSIRMVLNEGTVEEVDLYESRHE